MPRGHGIYRDEPRDELRKRKDDPDAGKAPIGDVAPDDTNSERAQEPPD